MDFCCPGSTQWNAWKFTLRRECTLPDSYSVTFAIPECLENTQIRCAKLTLAFVIRLNTVAYLQSE
jgi:hypothetical protein